MFGFVGLFGWISVACLCVMCLDSVFFGLGWRFLD